MLAARIRRALYTAIMSLGTAHVAVVALVSICVTVLGMAHVVAGNDATNIFIACVASFSIHGGVAALKGTG